MKKFRLIMLVYWVLVAVTMFTMIVNPFGWGQRVFWSMRPPYHWVRFQTQQPQDVVERYYGVNGLACANVYHYGLLMNYYKVYGYGFSEEAETRAMAAAVAEQECR